MAADFGRTSFDIGMVTVHFDEMVAFYRDVVGLEDMGTFESSLGHMQRLGAGGTLVKLIRPDEPMALPADGRHGAAAGYRYITFPITNVEEAVADCEEAGRPVVIPIRQPRPGLTIAMVSDPDGNWVEFARYD